MTRTRHIVICFAPLCLVAVLLALVAQVRGEDVTASENHRELFDRAVSLVRQADAVADENQSQSLRLCRDALDVFLGLREAGVRTAALEYNIATLYARIEEPGRAIAAALRAKRLAPLDARIDANLAFARRLRDGRLAATGTLFFADVRPVWNAVREHTVWLFVIAWNLAWLPIVIAARRGWRSGITPIAAGLAIVTGIGVAVIPSGTRIHSDERTAVVVVSDAAARKGCGVDYDLAVRLPPGDGMETRWIEVREDGTGRQWFRVAMPDGIVAWLPAEALEVAN